MNTGFIYIFFVFLLSSYKVRKKSLYLCVFKGSESHKKSKNPDCLSKNILKGNPDQIRHFELILMAVVLVKAINNLHRRYLSSPRSVGHYKGQMETTVQTQ